MATAARIDHAEGFDTQSARRDLAAAYRLIALFGWDDHIATHLSMRLPDGSFLMNPFGLMFDEITASNLMRIDLDGNLVEPCDHPVNAAGFNIHAGLLAARPAMNSVMHLHTLDGVAVSAMEEGLLPLSQGALSIWHDVAYHDFEGTATDVEERARLAADIGDKHLMILRNHGTLTMGRSIASAFCRLYLLEWACTAQVRTLAMGRALRLPTLEVQRKMGSMTGMDSFAEGQFWPAMLRKAERECPGFDA